MLAGLDRREALSAKSANKDITHLGKIIDTISDRHDLDLPQKFRDLRSKGDGNRLPPFFMAHIRDVILKESALPAPTPTTNIVPFDPRGADHAEFKRHPKHRSRADDIEAAFARRMVSQILSDLDLRVAVAWNGRRRFQHGWALLPAERQEICEVVTALDADLASSLRTETVIPPARQIVTMGRQGHVQC